jgi:TolB-like protein
MVRAGTVAIGYFDNNSGSDSYEYLRKALADMLITDLSVARSIRIVERAQLEVLLQELSLSESRFIDPTTALTIGRGLSADYVLTGAYTIVDTALRIDARLVRTETGEVVLAREVDGPLARFFALQKDLARRLLDALDVNLAPADERVFETPLTTSLAAVEQFGLGLGAADAGDTDAARQYFSAALDADPGFDRAREAMASLGRFMDALTASLDTSLADLSPLDPEIGVKLDALASSLLSNALTGPDQKARLLSWLVEAGIDPEYAHYGTRTRMQPELLSQLTTVAMIFEPALSQKILIAAEVLARSHPGNPSIRNLASMSGPTLTHHVANREEGLRELDRHALRAGVPFGTEGKFGCESMGLAALSGYQESLRILERVGEGALVEAYAGALMERSLHCRGSGLVNEIHDVFAWQLAARGRHETARRLASASSLPHIESVARGYQILQPADLRAFLREFEAALDAIARMDSRPQ